MINNNDKFRQTQAYIRKARDEARVHYKVTTIGGPEQHVAWKHEQERLEAEWQKAQQPLRAARRAIAVEGVANQNAKIELTAVARGEAAYLRAVAPDYKHLAPSYPPGVIDPPAPPTLTQKIRAAAAKLWRTAFPQ